MLASARLVSECLSLATIAILAVGCSPGAKQAASDTAADSVLAAIPPGELRYYPSGEYLKGGFPVSPPLLAVRFDHVVHIMKRQVSQAEYAACVKDNGCRRLDKDQRDAVAPGLPVVGVSWRDATDYAAWLSKTTGHRYRLPAFTEWLHAAGPDYKEDIVIEAFDPGNPAARWLAEYQLETQRNTAIDAVPRPFGSFGENAVGMQDMVSNVWDWTDTCHSRHNLDISDAGEQTGQNCGVRVVAGPHRSSITDFIRDPKGGACSVGIPPSNLGFRLVFDDGEAAPSLLEKLGLS